MNAVYRKADGLLTRAIAGETIVVPIRGRLADMQNIFAINSVGEFVWERIDGRRSLDEVVRDVAGQFDVDEGRARADVLEFVDELSQAGLVEK